MNDKGSVMTMSRYDLKDFSSFTVKQLKARAAWLEKVAAIREGKPADDLRAERDLVLAELKLRTGINK